jgi:hypothetical protein
MDLGSMGPYRQVRNRRDALNLEDEAAVKCSAPYRAPELTQVPLPFPSFPCLRLIQVPWVLPGSASL